MAGKLFLCWHWKGVERSNSINANVIQVVMFARKEEIISVAPVPASELTQGHADKLVPAREVLN